MSDIGRSSVPPRLRAPSKPLVALGFFSTLAALSAAWPAIGGDAGGVRIGGDVSITTSHGAVETTAEGEGATTVECIGAISGTDVRIEGSVTINGSRGGTDCTCEGKADCDATAAGGAEHPTDKQGR